jgi:hypothetical protein
MPTSRVTREEGIGTTGKAVGDREKEMLPSTTAYGRPLMGRAFVVAREAIFGKFHI